MTLDERYASKMTKPVDSVRCSSCGGDTIFNVGEAQPKDCFWCGTRLPRIPIYVLPERARK